MNYNVATLAVAVLLSACSQSPKRAITHIAEWSVTPCDAEIDGAVLGKLADAWAMVPQNTIADMDRYDRNLRCVREWADTLKDPCVRGSYYKWVASFERGSRARRDEINNPEKPFFGEGSEYEAEQRKIRDYERRHPIPAPPHDACDRSLIQKVKP